jgi:hypothetical protein
MASLRPRYAPTLFAALLLTTTAALALWRHQSQPRTHLPHAALSAATIAHATRDDVTLDERPIAIPERLLNERGCLTEPRRWVFPGATPAAVSARLRRALGDTAAYAQASSSMQCRRDGCVVDAPAAVVEAILPSERSSLYAELGASELNPAYANPFRRHPPSPPFGDSPGLPPSTRALIARTTWTQLGVAYFADLSAACELVHTDAERRALVRAIHRPMTLDVGLRTTPGAIERLVASVPMRSRPALRAALSAARARGAASVSLDVLLPASARRRAGTWPAPGEEDLNCFWTSLHFADGDTRERLPYPTQAAAALLARYDRLDDAPARFGDVIALHRADGALEHLAVHLFAGVFFTKNGASVVQPWRILRVEDLLIDYPQTHHVELWRRRDDP